MAKGLIESIELKISGASWNEVTVSEYVNNRRIEHKYYSIPKRVVMKLLNSSTTPTVSDFDGWVKEEEEREKKKSSKGTGECCPGNDWFSTRD
jgi:hypothetical protein